VGHRLDLTTRTNQWLPDSMSSYMHRSDPVQSENELVETIVAVEDGNRVAELWDHPLRDRHVTG